MSLCLLCARFVLALSCRQAVEDCQPGIIIHHTTLQVYNGTAMTTELTLLLPFSVPPHETADTLGTDLLKQLELPAFGKLLTHANTPGDNGADEAHGNAYLPTLPHERWLAAAANLPQEDGLPTAPYMRLATGAPAGTGPVACLQPIHIHAARDHLVLLNPDALHIEAAEAEALIAAIQPLLDDSGIRLEAPLPGYWFIPGTTFGSLQAASPARAIGRNIDLWMQSGERARDWRKFQNEIQMTWFDHPVNREREATGRLTVNSVWLHGMGAPAPVPRFADAVWADELFIRGLAMQGGIPATAVPAALNDIRLPDGRLLAVLDDAVDAYLNADWALWLDAMHAMEARWFAPALAAMQAGTLSRIQLVLANDTHYLTRTVTRAALRKFWRGFGTRTDWRRQLLASGISA